jgi:hypothetical protein
MVKLVGSRLRLRIVNLELSAPLQCNIDLGTPRVHGAFDRRNPLLKIANARREKAAAAISPIALEPVRRIDVLFDIERGINGGSAEECLRVRARLF